MYLPNFGNSVIALLKDGAVCFTIGFIDVMGKTNLIVYLNYGAHSREIYLGLALVYWIISMVLEYVMKSAEKSLGKGRRILKTN